MFHRYVSYPSVQPRAGRLAANIDPASHTGSTISTTSGSPVPPSDEVSSSVGFCGDKPLTATWGGDDDSPSCGRRQSAIESFWDGQHAAATAASQSHSQRFVLRSQSQRMGSQSTSRQLQRVASQLDISKSRQLNGVASQSQLPRATSQNQFLHRVISRSQSVREVPAMGAVDQRALHAALLAAQSDDTVSRKGLSRMLSARKRRPLEEDSGVSTSEVEVDCGRGGKKMVSVQRRASVRRKPLMDESKVRCFLLSRLVVVVVLLRVVSSSFFRSGQRSLLCARGYRRML